MNIIDINSEINKVEQEMINLQILIENNYSKELNDEDYSEKITPYMRKVVQYEELAHKLKILQLGKQYADQEKDKLIEEINKVIVELDFYDNTEHPTSCNMCGFSMVKLKEELSKLRSTSQSSGVKE